MFNFLYLAHSQERFRRQALFSVLSLLHYLKDSSLEHRIVVYTDDEAFFRPLDIVTQPLSVERITEWKGEIDFVHRMKIELMLHAQRKFEGRMMFLDSDNYIFADPIPFLRAWPEGTAIMDKLEYRLDRPADRVGRKYKRFFSKAHKFGASGARYSVNMQQPCWNSGIIGIPPSDPGILTDVLSVCDDVHSQFRKHLSEQMAFCIVLNRNFNIIPFRGQSFCRY